MTVHPSSRYRLLFSHDGIPNPFHKKARQEDDMVNLQGRDMILDRGTNKNTLEGARISDSLVTTEQFGGLSNRAEEQIFISLHVITVTIMGMLGAVAIFVSLLL